MRAVRALQKRLVRIERAALPKPSPFTTAFGSFDTWVERQVLPGIETGLLDRDDMIEVVAALRNWEQDGTWQRAFA
jgi:hypothetical protein